MRQELRSQEGMRRDDMTGMNPFIPTASTRRAAWLLAGRACAELPPAASAGISAGECERLELIDTIALHMQALAGARSVDRAELALCRRLLAHLRGPVESEMPALRLQ
jgi:hypothetical protein